MVRLFLVDLLDHAFERRGIDGHCLLEQAIEQQSPVAGRPTIKPKRVFIQVIGQMGMSDCSLMRPQQPSFQQGGDPMAVGQQVFPDFCARTNDGMPIAALGDLAISSPTIRPHGTAGLHAGDDGLFQMGGRGILHLAEPNTPDPRLGELGRDQDQCFPRCSTATFSRFLPPT